MNVKIPLYELVALLVVALTGSISLLLFWWLAFLGGRSWNPGEWALTIVFNRYGEQWLEGGIFHLFLVLSLIACWRCFIFIGRRKITKAQGR